MKNKNHLLRGLYGITDADLLPNPEILYQSVEEALRGGMQILQYRDKQNNHATQLKQAATLKELCDNYSALLIINDSVELTKAVGAHGVHLGRDDGDVMNARNLLGSDVIIGCSCYNSLSQAQQMEALGVDYVAFGRFFKSSTKPEAKSADINLLQQSKTLIDIPVCAIGGITTENAALLIQQGVDMLAVIHDLFSTRQVQDKARRFTELFKQRL